MGLAWRCGCVVLGCVYAFLVLFWTRYALDLIAPCSGPVGCFALYIQQRNLECHGQADARDREAARRIEMTHRLSASVRGAGCLRTDGGSKDNKKRGSSGASRTAKNESRESRTPVPRMEILDDNRYTIDPIDLLKEPRVVRL